MPRNLVMAPATYVASRSVVAIVFYWWLTWMWKQAMTSDLPRCLWNYLSCLHL